MIFENLQLDLEDLPEVETVRYQKLAPAHLTIRLISTGLLYALLLIGMALVLTFGEDIAPELYYILPTIWLCLAGISFWLASASYKVKAYALRQKDIVYRKGVIIRSVTTIPFNRVQHCEIKQGPIARFFGLKTLALFTAGGQMSDLSIPGLLPREAEQLKDFIIKKTAEDRYEEE